MIPVSGPMLALNRTMVLLPMRFSQAVSLAAAVLPI